MIARLSGYVVAVCAVVAVRFELGAVAEAATFSEGGTLEPSPEAVAFESFELVAQGLPVEVGGALHGERFARLPAGSEQTVRSRRRAGRAACASRRTNAARSRRPTSRTATVRTRLSTPRAA